jgi:hypothetical protein
MMARAGLPMVKFKKAHLDREKVVDRFQQIQRRGRTRPNELPYGRCVHRCVDRL